MKRSNFLILLVLLGVSGSFWQCGGDSTPAPDPKAEQIKKLTKTWVATGATLDGVSKTEWIGFQLKINPGGNATPLQIPYDASVGRPAGTNNSPWPGSGNFAFGTDFATVLTRSDITDANFAITYSVSDTQLQMTFNYNCTDCVPYSARVASVSGVWVFTFGL